MHGFKIHEFTVTRQRTWPDGIHQVEITQGNIDYTNPDALGKKYPGEFETFKGMTPAVETAIEIAKKWQQDSKTKILIAVGNTGGNTVGLDGVTQSKANLKALREKARQFDEKLPKCDHCGEVMDMSERWFNPDCEDMFSACSENCCGLLMEDYERQMAEMDEELAARED